MTLIKSFFVSTLLIGVVSCMLSCSSDDPAPAPIVTTTFANLNADSGTGRGPMGEILGATGEFTFFSFKTGEVVADADNTTSNWDIGFRGTTVIVNNGDSGPGGAGAIVSTGIFDELVTAPESGYDIDSLVGTKMTYAIPTGSDNGWYTYVPTEFVIKPKAGKFLIIRTSDGRYAKMEIISYYKDAPAIPNFMTDIDRFYTFRYVYQPNDSPKFE